MDSYKLTEKIVEAIIVLAHKLGIVETSAQLQQSSTQIVPMLSVMNCSFIIHFGSIANG
ncbi:MAG: hypothetical protein J7647_13680 [Cyanobacteria bacterium SBLK]|nr:hypothetical protein [Cyanobacteria bacterium SBLK]